MTPGWCDECAGGLHQTRGLPVVHPCHPRWPRHSLFGRRRLSSDWDSCCPSKTIRIVGVPHSKGEKLATAWYFFSSIGNDGHGKVVVCVVLTQVFLFFFVLTVRSKIEQMSWIGSWLLRRDGSSCGSAPFESAILLKVRFHFLSNPSRVTWHNYRFVITRCLHVLGDSGLLWFKNGA